MDDTPEIVCQYHRWTRTCPADSVLVITTANYGRTSTVPCISRTTVDCHLSSSLLVVQGRCFGKKTCSFNVRSDNAGDIFNNPCPGVNKYLEFTHHCIPGKSYLQSTTE